MVFKDLFHRQQHLFINDASLNRFIYVFNESKHIDINYSFHFVSIRRKNIFDLLYGTKSPTMHQLGLQFLSVYNGKFNYPEGHTVGNS